MEDGNARYRQWPIAGLSTALAAVLSFGSISSAAAQANCRPSKPVDTIKELGTALYACWMPPPGTSGMEITLTFSLRRDGTMIAKPRVSWSKLGGDIALQKAFVTSVLSALDHTLPVPITKGMGGAIAGRPLALRFSWSDTPTQDL